MGIKFLFSSLWLQVPTCVRLCIIILFILFSTLAQAVDKNAHNHPQIFHSFVLEADAGYGKEKVSRWDFSGWVGSDENKLWIKSEGETENNKTKRAEFWALYSRNIENFWDAQIGIGNDAKPGSSNYIIVGLNGLAPYFFETQAYIFLSEKGDLSARFRQEKDLLITQKLITAPYIELNLFAQKVESKQVSSGLGYGEIGLQTRYEITKKFAPYLDLRFEKRFGQTAKKFNEESNNAIISMGLKLRF